ncbi:MAG: FimV/HubP family polar landmark protein [Wenzhouxiangella sp.]|jgi:pilus assembly protein FimV|nr:FimV/HubP family polar landmark protein [Wenzhouxiangella sp.]
MAQEPEAGVATIGPVSADQTLWSIAREARPDRSVSIHQFMLALVARNPDAFAAGNVNMLREGSILEIPTAEEARVVSAAEASRRVTEQMQWYAELSPGEVQALHLEGADETRSVVDEPPAVASETAGVSVTELETIPLSGPEPAPLETAAEAMPPEQQEPDSTGDESGDSLVERAEEMAVDEIDESLDSGTEPAANQEVENPSAALVGATVDDAAAEEVEPEPIEQTVAAGGEDEQPAVESDSPAAEDAVLDQVEAQAAEESITESASMDPGPAEMSSEPMATDPMIAESKSDRGPLWPVWVVFGVFGVAALMVWVMARAAADPAALPTAEGRAGGSGRSPSRPEADSDSVAEPGETEPEANDADAAPIAPPPVAPRHEEPNDPEPTPPGAVDPELDASKETDAGQAEPEPSDVEPVRKTERDESPWAEFEASVLSSEAPESGSKSESQSISKSGDEADSGTGHDAKDDFDSDFDSDFDVEPEPEPESKSKSQSISKSGDEVDSESDRDQETDFDADFDSDFDLEPEPEEAPGLSDADAEVMIDLARLTAQGGDRGYAVQLLDEVISDASPEMAEQARELKASLLDR